MIQTIGGVLALLLMCAVAFFQIKDSDTYGEALFGTLLHGVIIAYIAWMLFG